MTNFIAPEAILILEQVAGNATGIQGTNLPSIYFDIFSDSAKQACTQNYRSGDSVPVWTPASAVSLGTRIFPTAYNASATFTAGFKPTVLAVSAINGSGQLTFTSTPVAVGMPVTIGGTISSGTLNGTGNYTTPVTMYIVATNGLTTATLSLTLNGSAVSSGAGTGAGGTYTEGFGQNPLYCLMATSAGTTAGVEPAWQSPPGILNWSYFNTANITSATAQAGTVTTAGIAGQFTISTPSTPLFIGMGVRITGTDTNSSIVGYTNPTIYKISATNGSSTFTLTTQANGAIVTLNSTVCAGLSFYYGCMTTVVTTGTAGQLGFDPSPYPLVVGMPIQCVGALGGITINGYTNPTQYYIIATNGSTTATISTTPGGSGVVCTIGTPTGVGFFPSALEVWDGSVRWLARPALYVDGTNGVDTTGSNAGTQVAPYATWTNVGGTGTGVSPYGATLNVYNDTNTGLLNGGIFAGACFLQKAGTTVATTSTGAGTTPLVVQGPAGTATYSAGITLASSNPLVPSRLTYGAYRSPNNAGGAQALLSASTTAVTNTSLNQAISAALKRNYELLDFGVTCFGGGNGAASYPSFACSDGQNGIYLTFSPAAIGSTTSSSNVNVHVAGVSAYGCSGSGLVLLTSTGNSNDVPINGILVEDSSFYNNQDHGSQIIGAFGINGVSSDVTGYQSSYSVSFNRCSAWNNGVVSSYQNSALASATGVAYNHGFTSYPLDQLIYGTTAINVTSIAANGAINYTSAGLGLGQTGLIAGQSVNVIGTCTGTGFLNGTQTFGASPGTVFYVSASPAPTSTVAYLSTTAANAAAGTNITSTAGTIIGITFSQWLNTSGNIMSTYIGAYAPHPTYTINAVFGAIIRSVSGIFAAPLRQNTVTPTTPGTGEFGFVSATGFVYVNLGATWNTATNVKLLIAPLNGIQYNNCESYLNNLYVPTGAEGFGICGDEFSTITQTDCYMHDNQGGGTELNFNLGSKIIRGVYSRNGYGSTTATQNASGISVSCGVNVSILGARIYANANFGINSTNGSHNTVVKQTAVEGHNYGVIWWSDPDVNIGGYPYPISTFPFNSTLTGGQNNLRHNSVNYGLRTNPSINSYTAQSILPGDLVQI